jgi:tRNA-specific 2-thiouridylase
MQHRKQNKPKVIVLMSGGVDSSVAALLLQEQGYDVTGVHLRFWNDERDATENRCCSLESFKHAQNVCDILGIPLFAWDIRDRFYTQVVQYFIDELGRARTPNPCVECNRRIKLGWALKKARALGFAAVATGHWVRISKHHLQETTVYRLHQARNLTKDQSYFLYTLNQEQLAHILFPLQHIATKDEIRAIAHQHNFPTFDKPDSQEICFLPHDDKSLFFNKFAPHLNNSGLIVDSNKTELGTHKGLAHYTEGQRRGLVVAAGKRLYVVAKKKETNTLVLGPAKQALSSTCTITHVTWINPEAITLPLACTCKIRYQGKHISCRVETKTQDACSITLHYAVSGIAPGQSLVLYQRSQVLGGGIISTGY